ncbi:hypothetical protein OAG34_01185 [bacterium]|jgi:hypothetical protein|nr:hypothetical protein [bacterium]
MSTNEAICLMLSILSLDPVSHGIEGQPTNVAYWVAEFAAGSIDASLRGLMLGPVQQPVLGFCKLSNSR